MMYTEAIMEEFNRIEVEVQAMVESEAMAPNDEEPVTEANPAKSTPPPTITGV